MSVKIMSMVFDNQELDSTQKLIMLALADHANDEGKSIYPSQDTLSLKTGLARETINRKIRELIGLGYLIKKGYKKSRAGVLELEIIVQKLGVTDDHIASIKAPKITGGVTEDHRGCDGGSHKPSVNHQLTANLKDSPPLQDDQFLTPPKPPSDHQPMVHALEVATGMDMKIKSNAGQIARSAKELRDAGYKPSDVEAFSRAWRSDWRYRQDRSLPSLATIKREIKRNLTPEELRAEEKRKDAEIIASFGKTIDDVPKDKRHLSGEPLYNFLQAVKQLDEADKKMEAGNVF